jgi:hypothetical protein
MHRTLAVGPIVYNVVVGRAEGGRIRVRAPGVLVFNVTHETAIPIPVAVHEEHHSEILILGSVSSLLSFGVGRYIRVGCNLFKNGIRSIGMSADVAAHPFRIGDQVFKLFIVFVVCEDSLFKSVHLRFGIK